MVRAMRNIAALSLTLSLLLLPACKRNYNVETNAPATAGKAHIVLDRDKAGNGKIDLEFDHLAAPSDIDPSLSTYVVWVQVEGKDPYKLGLLDYKEKKRTGKLSATYSDDQFTLSMTVEADPATSAPTGAKVLELPVVAPPQKNK